MSRIIKTEKEQEFLNILGKRVKLKRIEKELSQEKLAARADLSYRFISLLERGKQTPTIISLQRTALALDTTLSELLKEVENILQT